MSVNAAKKGRRNEHKSRRVLECLGYRVVRSAGSLGPFDLIGLSTTDVVALQVRSNRPPPAMEVRELADYAVPPNCRRLVHIWHDGHQLPEVRVL